MIANGQADASARAATEQRMRRLLAHFCKLLGEQLLGNDPVDRTLEAAPASDALSPIFESENLRPRLRQTLERLLAGDSEKEAASRLGVSPHTVHVYVKGLYRHYGVCSRGELLALFVRTIPADQILAPRVSNRIP